MRGSTVIASVLLLGITLPMATLLAWRNTPAERTIQLSRTYSFTGKDYPRRWDLDLEIVHKATEDSRHYGHDTDLGLQEWSSLLPTGDGLLFFGPDDRVFSISMFHQLRCLNIIGKELYDRQSMHPRPDPSALSRHCANYLRQMILCRADTRLESAFSDIGPRIVISAVTHKCTDWTTVYAAAEQNYKAHRAEVDRAGNGSDRV